MADKRGVLAVISILLALTSLAAAKAVVSTANDTTGSSPVQCSSGTTQIRTKESSSAARKTLAKSWSHRTVVAELLQRNSARVRVEEKFENG